MTAADLPGISHDYLDSNGARIHYAHAGDGPLIVFLHGFPQCWYEFRAQLTEFSRDHLAVAPDLRGYNLSSKPQAVWEYGIAAGVEDLRALADHLGHERFVLVGHDWGGGIGWAFAMQYPERLDALVVISTAHPALFDRELRGNPEQQRASLYMHATRLPNAAELLSADDYAALRSTFDLPWMPQDAREAYLESWRRPGALAGACSWYRREGLGPPTEDGTPSNGNYALHMHSHKVEVPTLVIYPERDEFTMRASHDGLDRYVPDLTFRTVEGASHWVVDQHPDLVSGWIREYLESRVPAAAA